MSRKATRGQAGVLSGETALVLLASLAHSHRLALFRAVSRQGGRPLPAGELAALLRISPSCLMFHASKLESAGLVRISRDQRETWFEARIDALRELVDFLVEDCCGGNPASCFSDTLGHSSDTPETPGAGSDSAAG